MTVPGGGLDVARVGGRAVEAPDPLMAGHHPTYDTNIDPVQAGVKIDESAVHGRVNGVVAGVAPHVAVPAETDPLAPAQM